MIQHYQFLINKKSIFEIFDIFKMYEKSSGAKINVQKSEIMCIGTSRICEEDKKLLSIPETNFMKILGIYFDKNKTECEILNWRDKDKKIKQTLNLWRQRMLTIHGRVSLLMSKLWYSLSVKPIPFWARDFIQ